MFKTTFDIREIKLISKNLRLFSSTYFFAQVRPEHPFFIDVPGQLHYQRPLRQRDVKGTLPPPRDVLKTRALQVPKNHLKFRLATTPDPKFRRQPLNQFGAWKQRMAELRKKNLRESIIELYERKKKRHELISSLSIARSRLREKLLNAPQREDERLTSPTIPKLNSSLQRGLLPDPNRAERIAEKIARVKAIEEAKVEARKTALQGLYINAQNFITTENQLDTRIQQIFTEQPFQMGGFSNNIWDVGSPPTIRDMLKKYEGKSKVATEAHQSSAVLIGDRIRIIVEELTGGKMKDEPNSSKEL